MAVLLTMICVFSIISNTKGDSLYDVDPAGNIVKQSWTCFTSHDGKDHFMPHNGGRGHIKTEKPTISCDEFMEGARKNVLTSQHVAEKFSDFGYWKCENDIWERKYNPAYEKPKLSCAELRIARSEPKKVWDYVPYYPSWTPEETAAAREQRKKNCEEAGGESAYCYCTFKYQDAGAPCSDNDECVGKCFPIKYRMIDNSPYGSPKVTTQGKCEGGYGGMRFGCGRNVIDTACSDGGCSY